MEFTNTVQTRDDLTLRLQSNSIFIEHFQKENREIESRLQQFQTTFTPQQFWDDWHAQINKLVEELHPGKSGAKYPIKARINRNLVISWELTIPNEIDIGPDKILNLRRTNLPSQWSPAWSDILCFGQAKSYFKLMEL